MLRVAVMVSGGGTNLQAIIDGVKNKTITTLTFDVLWPLGDDVDPYSDEVNSSSNFLEINFSVEQYKGEVITPYTTG